MTDYLSVVIRAWGKVKSAGSATWGKVKSAGSTRWGKVKSGWSTTWGKRLNRWDAIHFGVSLALFGGAWLSLDFRWSGWPAVIVIYVDLVGLLLLAACRCHCWLPDRLTALAIVPLTFFALILAFATIFLKCDCFEQRGELSIEPKTAVVTVSEKRGDLSIEPMTAVVTISPPQMLHDGLQATYVSLAVITTAAPDYAPTTRKGRSAVAWETVSGLLFLLVAFPILAARLALFPEGASRTVDHTSHCCEEHAH
jgi:hypothetical protein